MEERREEEHTYSTESQKDQNSPIREMYYIIREGGELCSFWLVQATECLLLMGQSFANTGHK